MPDEFSFRSLIKPGLGATVAIQRELQVRFERENMYAGAARVGWEPYPGVWTLLKEHGTGFAGRVTPEPYRDLYGPQQKCHLNSLIACQKRPELRYFTGLYTVGRQICDHSWCVDEENKVVELTYPTFGLPPDARMRREEDHGVSDFGWLPPDHWAYFGLEFVPQFVEALIEMYGLYLPILESVNPYNHDLLHNRYDKHGWPLPASAP